MKILEIEIHNFQSYYEKTLMEFGDGLNLVIGNGGKGKSKLFNAFYWVLFGDIYITDLGWCSTNGLPHSAKFTMGRHEFINKKALYECKVGESVLCQVSLKVEDEKSEPITIERTVKATRKQEGEWHSTQAWDVSMNMLKVTFDGIHGTQVFNDGMAEVKISDMFPEGIRGYIWFQGESLDNLINFRKKENLKDAVKHISYFPYYEKMTTIIDSACKKIKARENRHLNEVNKQNGQAKTLLFKMEQLRNKLEVEESNRKALTDTIEKIQVILAEDEGKINGLAKFTELVSKYDRIGLEIKDILYQIEKIDNEERKLLPSLWVLRNTETLIKESKRIINEHVEEEYTIPEKKYLDNPSRAKLEEILYKDHQCFVCGSKVDDEHPETRDWILNRLRMQDEYLREMEEYTNNIEFNKQFNMFVGKIQDYPDQLLVSISSIDKVYQDMEKKMDDLRIKYKLKLSQKAKIDEQIEDIKRKHGVDPHREAEKYTTFDSSIKASRANLEKKKKELLTCEDNIRKYKTEIKEVEKEISKTGSSIGMVTEVEETEWRIISTVLTDICKTVQEKARKELLKNIEERANEFYVKFTEHDSGYKGKVEIGDDYSIVYDAGLNTSHEDRKKMSIINALLSLNQEALGIHYPFISDAPTSSFDFATTYKYLIGIKDIFSQSIIMTKDVEIGSDNYLELMNEIKVSRIFQLTSRNYSSESREPEIYEVSTNVERLK